MKKKSVEPTGRVVVDDRGRSVWQTPLSTAQLKALSERLYLEGEAPPEEAARHKRRTLDDMRKLSEQIKASKVWFRAPKRPSGGSSS